MAEEIYQREGSPYFYYQVPILDKHGHVITYERRSTKRKDQREARRYAQAMVKRILDRGQHGVKDDPMLLDFIDECIQESEALGQTNARNQRNFQKWLVQHFAARKLRVSQLDRVLLEKTRRAFRLDGKGDSYTNNLMTFMIAVYNKARKLGLDVPLGEDFRGLKVSIKWKTRYLMDGEEERLLFELDPRRSHSLGKNIPLDYRRRELDQPLIQQKLQDSYDLTILLIDTGLRVSEATQTGLWSSVDTTNFKSLNFYRDKVGSDAHLVCTDRLSEMLQRRYKRVGNSPFIFPSRSDPMQPRSNASGGIKSAIERAGLNAPHLVKRYGRFTPHHTFRHTFASRLVQAGMSLYAVAGLLGHSTKQGAAMTQRYAHLQPAVDAQRAADILNGATR